MWNRICLILKIAQAGTLQGSAGLLAFRSLLILKQLFADTAQEQKQALPAAEIGASSITLPK